MSSPTGTRIGPFDVGELLGAGGMGAVYRAFDPRLRREVAIKVLPAAFAADHERLRRFEHEALAVARLAHPNILAIHDIGQHDGAPYIVTELLRGETLRQRLQGGPLPARRAIEYAIQICRGLAAAHECGVIHRDIKPENLFVTADGRITILDFGVAKLADANAAESGAITLTAPEAGLVGTAPYMSPEQARGGAIDQRSDLFSFGCVLHEMLSGVPLFRRGTAAETISAILRDDPPDLTAADHSSPGLARIVRHCLEKEPAARYQTARDLAFDLEGVNEAGAPAIADRQKWRRHPVIALAMCGVLAAAAAGSYLAGQRAAVMPTPVPVGVAGVHRLTDFVGIEEFPAIAPDLKSVAFVRRVDGHRHVFVRLLAGGIPLQITKDAADHEMPRWSGDSSALVYFSPAVPGDRQGTIWEIPALGGPPRRLIDSVGGGDVAANGEVACFRLAGGDIELVAVKAGGAGERVVARFSEPVYYKFPRWSPDGKWIAYQRGDGVRWDVFVIPSAGGSPRQLTQDNRQIHGLSWRADGTGVVYSSSRGTSTPYLATQGLWEVDLAGGDPRRVAPTDLSYLHPDVHRSGAMVASRLEVRFDLWRYPVTARPDENMRGAARLTRQTAQVQTPTVGATDREVAYLSDSGGHANIWVTSPDTGEMRQITYERDPAVSLGLPIWSPDGKWIAFVSSRGNRGLSFGVWLVSPDGGNQRQFAERGLGVTWSPDGQWLYYTDGGALFKAPAGGGASVRVRPGPVRNAVGIHGSALFFMVDRALADSSPGFEIHRAAPEDAESTVIARIAAHRVPQWQILNPALSPDGSSLALPLTDGETTNIWTLSVSTGQWRQVTDFGTPTFIVRRASWSTDGRFILAAVGDGDADIVMFDAPVRTEPASSP
jgi:Tol biopolymer transport system component